MNIQGIVRQADLQENPPGSDRVEMVLRVQGVGPNQPRRFIVPFELLLSDPTLEPELIVGHAFRADLIQEAPERWVALEVTFADNRVLRSESEGG